MKQMKKTLETPEKVRKASATAVSKLSAALMSGLGWGLEVFLPSKRALPGQPLVKALPDRPGLSPDVIETPVPMPVLVLTSDEGPDQKLAHSFLTSVGLRCRYERDFYHRWDNSHTNAVSSAGYSEVTAKVLFLSRVNRTPFGSGANARLKSELLDQLGQVVRVDPQQLLSFEAGFRFDTRQTVPWSDKVLDEMLGGATTIDQKTEGAP